MSQLGDRVLAQWPVEVEWWYPGVVVAADGSRLVVQFDDGDRSPLAASQVMPMAVASGTRVFGRYQGGRYYYPGAVTSRTGDAIHIAYDDGDQEWTSVGMVRVHADDLPAHA